MCTSFILPTINNLSCLPFRAYSCEHLRYVLLKWDQSAMPSKAIVPSPLAMMYALKSIKSKTDQLNVYGIYDSIRSLCDSCMEEIFMPRSLTFIIQRTHLAISWILFNRNRLTAFQMMLVLIHQSVAAKDLNWIECIS